MKTIRPYKLWKLRFMTCTHIAITATFSLMAIIFLIGSLYNPIHAFMCFMSIILAIVSYREKVW
ncbi:hypothetical protein M2459_001379 [Parabacteroides sp. PF5-5]|nr:hypothetical protein [Parabacteroides sp. PH5-39]MDH6315743.1 hypothetical protein [Parabacteroides sp. PF5-13]MDH6319403.1 hypothetical protein [Parabacteroides sp. PH5-13]MDH6323134.1 hypothetical protein [Parabacteroides sp. PH5-8]MDH6326936.1 hypothetical protein [Parabacteroides sp. PH5-41]MDH6334635.1 hypothetical protein [Parabacteroides sp. PF5-5]MDH6345699.1 hypothetical protein [Parabacteroides sp. PH5-46]MDH6360655.1 hypothetical protein [Parabacteroides sp. PH5-16]MDH6376423.